MIDEYVYIETNTHGERRSPINLGLSVTDRKLTKEQFDWVNGWLELWGAWVHSGRIAVKASSIIYELMLKVGTAQSESRPMCSDEEGMLISDAIDRVLCIDKVALGLLISYYAYGASKRAIAKTYHFHSKPRRMKTKGGGRYKKPSLITCRREVDDILDASVYLVYFSLKKSFSCHKRDGNRNKLRQVS